MKTIGIIGGMGPLATVDLFEKIVRSTEAERDQDHIHVLIDSNTAIPDRTAAILGDGEDPVPQLTSTARNLERAGADVLLMPCNTAHYFYDRVAASVGVPVLHMIRETAVAAKTLGYSKCALLATDGTCRTGIYDAAFAGQGVALIKPDQDGQAAIMSLIYDGVKAGRQTFATDAVIAAIGRLEAAGAQALILGCTELPIAFPLYHLPGNTIDPTQVLAERAIAFAGGKVRAR